MEKARTGAPKPLARSLGEFVGHILRAVKTDPSKPRAEVRRETTTETRDTPQGPITLRRTVIEEVELPAPQAGNAAPPGGGGGGGGDERA